MLTPAEVRLRRRLRALAGLDRPRATPPVTSDPVELLVWRVGQLEREVAATRAEQSRIWWALLAALLIGAAVRVLV